jgi:hypothetical protein
MDVYVGPLRAFSRAISCAGQVAMIASGFRSTTLVAAKYPRNKAIGRM